MALRDDLNGMLLRRPGRDAIYLVLNGRRRLVPDPRTLDLLFQPETPVRDDVDPDTIDDGGPLVRNAWLVRATDRWEVYLVPGSHTLRVVGSEAPATDALGWGNAPGRPDIDYRSSPPDHASQRRAGRG